MQRRSHPAQTQPPLGHIVGGKVVVGAEVKGRAEPGVVVPHKSGGHQKDGQGEEGKLYGPPAGEQPPIGDILLPEDGQGQEGEDLHLGAAAGHQGHAQTAQHQMGKAGAAVFVGGVGGGHPLPQSQQHKGGPAQDHVLVDRGAQQQIIQLGASRHSGGGKEIGGGGNAGEPSPGRLLHQPEGGEHRRNGHDDHADAGGQVPGAGNGLKGQLEQQAGHHAEVDIVPAVVVGHIPQGVGGLGGSGHSIVGIVHGHEGFRRVQLQVQAAVEQGMGQRPQLAGGVLLPVVDVLGEIDVADAVPVIHIIIGGGHPGIDGVGKGDQGCRQAEGQNEPGHTGTKACGRVKVAAVPEAARRPQGPPCQQNEGYHGKAQQREAERLGRVGSDAGKGVMEGMPDIFPVIGGGGEGQPADFTGKVQHPGPAAGGLPGYIPAAPRQTLGVGLVGGGHLDGEQRVLPVGILSVIEEGEAFQLQIVQRLVDAGKAQLGAVPRQDDLAVVAPLHVAFQIVEQLDGNIVVSGKILHIAQKDLKAQGGENQQRSDPQPSDVAGQGFPQPESADAGGYPGRGGAQGAEPEQPEIHKQSRPAEKEKSPDPHTGQHRSGDAQIPAGGTAVLDGTGQQGKSQTERSGCQQRDERHVACLLLRKSAGIIPRLL